MRKPAIVLGILSAGLGLVASGTRSARADFTTNPQTISIPLTQTNWSPTTSSLAGLNPFVLQQFDVSKYSTATQTAQLTKVSLTLDYQFENSLNLRFDNVSTITVTAQGTMTLYKPDGKTTAIVTPQFTNSQVMTSTPSDVFSKYVTLPQRMFPGSQSANYTDTATLKHFLGNGTVSLPVYAMATSSFTSTSANGFGGSVTLASAKINLVYSYILVPEPSAFALTGLGMMGLAWATRRRPRVGVKNSSAS